MNTQLQEFARNKLKDGLKKLPENHQALFKRMYSHKNTDRDIGEVVDVMDSTKLDTAMRQVQRSIDKIASRSEAK